MSCAICIDGTIGMRPRQITEDGPLFAICKSCDELDAVTIRQRPPRYKTSGRGRFGSTNGKYMPLDESERGLVYRILRAIRHFDWISSLDLSELLGIPTFTADHTERNNYSVALSRLARGRYLQRRCMWPHAEYRITRLGLARLENAVRAAVESKRSLAA